jgi:cyclohexadieny/prephenate dehydrogenase
MAIFDKIALIGIGLIGSSIARVVRERSIADNIAISTRSQATLDKARDLNLGDVYETRIPIDSITSAQQRKE